MEDRYKDYIDQIHAPAQLIEDTIKKVKEEEKASKKFKRKSFYPYLAAGTVAAMVTVAVGINFSMNSVVYTNISEPMIRINDRADKYNSMSIEDYEKYVGIDLEDLINEENIERSSIDVIMGEDGVTPVYDEAVFSFSVDGKLMTTKLSKTEDISPEQLIESPESKVGSYKIHFGTDDSGKKLYAGGNFNGVNYYITGNGIEKKEFKKKIEKILNNMKPFES